MRNYLLSALSLIVLLPTEGSCGGLPIQIEINSFELIAENEFKMTVSKVGGMALGFIDDHQPIVFYLQNHRKKDKERYSKHYAKYINMLLDHYKRGDVFL